MTIQELVYQWRTENWDDRLGEETLLALGVSQVVLDAAVDTGWLTRRKSVLHSFCEGWFTLTLWYSLTKKAKAMSDMAVIHEAGLVAFHHLDGDVHNNSLGNLVLVSTRENRRKPK